MNRFSLYDYQIPPTLALEQSIAQRSGIQLVGVMGCGKTIICLEALRRLKDDNDPIFTDNEFNKIIILVPAKSVIQWQRFVMQYELSNDVMIIAHSEIRSGAGELYINWETRLDRNGEVDYVPSWNTILTPRMIIVDENHHTKNPNSLVSKIIQDACDQGIPVSLMSGTPYILMSETYVVCRALGLCNNRAEWNILVDEFCHGEDPTKSHPTILENFNNFLEEQGKLVKVRKVRFKHRLKTKYIQLTLSPNKRRIYNQAYEQYLEKVRLVRTGFYGYRSRLIEVLVAQMQFRRCAEALRADELAIAAKEAVETENKQVLVFFTFTGGLRICKKFLSRLGVEDSQISIIWGAQSRKVNQANIDRFQAGKTSYCLVSLKAGGDCLNLNHDSINGKPRVILMSVSFSCVDFAQAMYRGHRVNSLSTSEIRIFSYKNTVEDRVIDVLTSKNYSLATLIGKRASFADVFEGKEFKLREDEEDDEYMTFGDKPENNTNKLSNGRLHITDEDREYNEFGKQLALDLPVAEMLEEEDSMIKFNNN